MARPSRLKPAWLATLIAGSIVLAFFFEARFLLRKRQSPSSRQIGWQANQIAFLSASPAQNEELASNDTYSSRPALSKTNSTFPNIYDPWLYNPTPLTAIYVLSCAFPPGAWSTCNPPTSPLEDVSQGPWVRVEHDLNRKTGLWYLYMFYRRRVQGSPLPVVQDVVFLSPDEAKSSNWTEKLRTEGWLMVDENLHSGIWGSQTLNLWYRRSNDIENAYTELDVVYGDGPPRPTWQDIGTISTIKDEAKVRLLGRRTPARLPPVPELLFDSNGNFTILQIADLHFSVDGGECRDIANETACTKDDADSSTLVWLRPLFDEFKPDLVVLSGDQLNGQDTSWDGPSVINKVASLFENTTIPWTVIFGNHDSEGTNVDRENMMKIYQSFPYFVGQIGPAEVKGSGNYLLPMYSSEGSHTNLFNLYFLDSHASFKPLFGKYDYEPMHDSQIRWFKQTSSGIDPILRPFQPADLSHEKDVFGIADSSTDIDSQIYDRQKKRRRRARAKRQEQLHQDFKKPAAMAFFHIPLPETYDVKPDSSTMSGDLEIGTTDLEGYSAPRQNAHFFEKALLAQKETDAVTSDPEIKVTVHGHSHLRDACSRIKGIWMCFSGGSSYAGYGLRGFDRRVRVFRISDYGETIETWKVLDGSGQGDRESGIFESASAAQATATTAPDASNHTGEAAYDEQVEGLINGLEEEEKAVQSSDPGQAEAIEELVQEIEEEYTAEHQESRRQSRPIIDHSREPEDRRHLDHVTLYGKGAIA